MLANCHIQRLQRPQGLTRRRTTPKRGIAAKDVGYGTGKNACLYRDPLSSTLWFPFPPNGFYDTMVEWKYLFPGGHNTQNGSWMTMFLCQPPCNSVKV